MITMLKCNCRCCSHVVDVEHKSLDDKTEAEAVRYLRENFKGKKTVLPALEFAARLNREIGLGTNGDTPGGVTIRFISNLRPGALRRRPKEVGVKKARRRPDIS